MGQQTNGGRTIAELMSGGHATSVDLLEARSVELETRFDGRLWLNVDGVCVFRVKSAGLVVVNSMELSRLRESGPEGEQ